MNIIAIDLGKFNSMVCFFDSATNEYRFQLVRTEQSYLKTLLARHPSDLVVMESCAASGWVADLCDQLKLKRLVCSTHEEAWRWRNTKRKTDKDDALKLARLAAMGQLKATHVPARAMREYRGLIKYRKKLIGTENRLKNSIRSLFHLRGIAISRGERTWHTGRAEINEYRKPLSECSLQELWRGQLDQLLTQLDQTQTVLKTVEKKLDAIAKPEDAMARPLSIGQPVALVRVLHAQAAVTL